MFSRKDGVSYGARIYAFSLVFFAGAAALNVRPKIPAPSASLASFAQEAGAFEAEWAPDGRELPFPFSKISVPVLASFNRHMPFTQNLKPQSGVLLPYSRSPQRAGIDFDHPRVLITNGHYDRPYFIAYSEAANEIEVISWNNHAGRFDFLEVSQYGPNTKTKISFADRKLCLACHQSGGPIFPHEVWFETNAGDFSDATLNELKRHQSSQSYEGVPIENRGGAALFENLVKSANRLTQARTACRTGCGENLDCRRHVLETAVLDHFSSKYVSEGRAANNNEVDFDKNAWARQLVQAWPVDGFAYADPSISDVLSTSVFHEFTDQRYVDPKSRRPLTEAIAPDSSEYFIHDVASDCLGFTGQERQFLAQYTRRQLTRALNETISVRDFQSWPILADALMPKLKVALKRINNDVRDDQKIRPRSFLRTEMIPDSGSRTDVTPYGLLKKYCIACHGPGGIDIRLGNADEVKKYKNSLSASWIDNQNMPLPESDTTMPTEKERSEMSRWLRGLPPP